MPRHGLGAQKDGMPAVAPTQHAVIPAVASAGRSAWFAALSGACYLPSYSWAA